MELTKFECPNCGAKEMVQDDRGWLTCAYCHSSFGEATRICPNCGEFNDQGVRHCAGCGEAMIRDCPACGTDNWILAEHCVNCGRSMNVVDQMVRRWQQTTSQRLSQWRAGVADLKAREEEASRQRMAELMEAEHIREQALALAAASRRRRDQQLYVALVVGLAIFVILIAVIFLLSVGGG